ncbi:ATP-dependent DNA helicase UvrD2 [Brevibacterium casei]|uniref:DNA 3'-5' helicase n=2 Tax=Bacteria TaxID=2 RepID=A0A269ZDQ4_9MICO|nr:ATP-dependent DNA helicase UvrD2 [Brevibacterium casei]MCT1551099.1 ATP-dependent DNA helicase UvrD2 [Brevibacterium casei]MCT1560521.1 ATP-dependent DNA helicase UvrD2 [Brevibacterium casei]MCT2208632.1 ATP-dependent DNA helicase UvrD2 [Brevibacterium casei]PAK95933.1 DNA helicase [Brevibacterium casei]QPS32574.1 ATP-dependent DNA helicase UvrD2 [Brevibacterium casei]
MNARAADLLAALDDEQREVATHFSSPVIVLAGAGTGKTRAMTHRIAYGIATEVFPPHHVLALTFTAKAAGEMRARLRSLGVPAVQARTFHSAALRQLRFFWDRFAGGDFPRIIENKAGVLGSVMQDLGIDVSRELARDVAAEIEYAAASLLGIEDYAMKAQARELPGDLGVEDMVRIAEAYSEAKTRGRLLDFEDVLLVLDGALAEYPAIAAEVREQYRHFVVDEFQDVSPLQFDLLTRWLGPRENLCVVGDPAQTIYSFAGADASLLESLPSSLSSSTTIRLVRNYRSSQAIVSTANSLLRHTSRTALTLRTDNPEGRSPRMVEYPTDEAEAVGVVQAIAAEVRAGRRPRDIAVLFRTNGQSPAFEQALTAAGIPYVLRGGERFFARKEVKEGILMLRAARAAAGARPLPEIVAEVLASAGYTRTPPPAGASRQKWESLKALVDLAETHQAASELPVPLDAFLADLADRAEHQFAPDIEGVTLASFHAAKGLEWDSVHLVGLSEGLLPISYAQTPRAIAEERRLFYVAVTRAGADLSLSWSLARHASKQKPRSPSRFLSELGRVEESTGGGRRPGTTVTTNRCRACGRVLVSQADRALGRCAGCPAEVDLELLDRLRRWRARVGLEQGLPPYLVLTDTSLSAIAEMRPGDLTALARIPGVGATKLELYGSSLLRLIAG